jgi:secreted Zn-dependent insulinase-like peptidase
MLRYYCDSTDGFPPYIFDELRKIQECSYKFEDEPNPSELVEKIAEYLAPYKDISPERLLDGEVLFHEFDPAQIKVRRFKVPMEMTYLNISFLLL